MFIARLPNWLDHLEKRFSWFSLPNLAIYLVVVQVFGFLFLQINPQVFEKMVLHPSLVLQGEWWRVVSFLAIPLSTNLFFQLIVVWFLFFIVNIVESSLGEFKTTLYLVIALVLANIFSFVFQVPVYSAAYIQLSFFLAVAVLMPDAEILLFFILPVKIKYLGYISLAFVLFSVVFSNWYERVFLIFMLANFFLFFYPGLMSEINYRIKRLQK